MARIGVLCDREFFSPFDQRVYKSAVSLHRAGHVVELITPHPTNEARELEGMMVQCMSTSGPPGITALRMVRQALRGDYDLLYCHELDPLLYSLIWRPLTGRPVIWDCHEYLVQMKHELQGPLSAVLTQLALEVAGPRVDSIVTVDNRLARQLARWGPVTVLANYPRQEDFPISGTPRVAENEVPVLLYVGSLTEQRGARKMVEAFKVLRETTPVRLEVAGGFNDPRLEGWARGYNERYDLDIRWHGWVDHRKLEPLLTRADVGLFLSQPSPRYLKGVPTKLFEYMVCGLPILASSGPLIDRLILGNGCGLTVDPTEPEAIAKGLVTLLADPDLSQMGLRGQTMAKANFTWEAKEAKLVSLVEKVLKVHR